MIQRLIRVITRILEQICGMCFYHFIGMLKLHGSKLLELHESVPHIVSNKSEDLFLINFLLVRLVMVWQ